MADLSGFATKEKADEGIVIPVKLGGIKIPLAIKIYGSDSDIVKEFERAKVRKLNFVRKGKNTLDAEDVEELLENQDEAIIIRIGGIWTYDWDEQKTTDEPIELFGKTLGCDKKSYEYLVDKMPAIKDWVLEKSNDRNNFLSVGKKN